MTAQAQRETLGFETEAKQLLHLMIHSLYSNKEIFLRELISNAADAADKLRFESLSKEGLLEADGDLKVKITADKDNGTVIISDNGIGMSREEVIKNLGTIARSGTAEFMKNLSGDQKKDAQLIGQFGVGFYSAFIVADKVEVLTRRAGAQANEGIRWESSGEADYQIENIEKADRGTTIILHLKESEKEFLENFRLKSIVKKYSDHIAIPVIMEKEVYPEPEESTDDTDADAKTEAEKAPTIEDEVVNEATALWTKPSKNVKKAEYIEFYKHVSHDFQEPLTWSHNRVEGKLDYTSLLYVPARAPFDMWNREQPRGLKLYVQRVFIMDEADQFLPLYLRFIKGVVDSNDLSLNVSREILQKDEAVEAMRKALTKRVLDILKKLASKDKEKYLSFWNEFGQVLKEGPAEDYANREAICKLFRFATTHDDKSDQVHSLDEYIERMRPEQEKIYYICADTFNTAKNSPHLEVFRKKNIEVLLLSDRVDEWMMSQLSDYQEKKFQDITKGELDLGKLDDEKQDDKDDDKKQQNEQFEGLLKQIKEVLKDKIQDVRLTDRLTDSPACLVVGEYDMGQQMRKIMQAAGQSVPETKPTLEINGEHTLIERLNTEADDDRATELIHLVFENAQLAEGSQLDDPASYVKRLNKLILELSH